MEQKVECEKELLFKKQTEDKKINEELKVSHGYKKKVCLNIPLKTKNHSCKLKKKNVIENYKIRPIERRTERKHPS